MFSQQINQLAGPLELQHHVPPIVRHSSQVNIRPRNPLPVPHPVPRINPRTGFSSPVNCRRRSPPGCPRRIPHENRRINRLPVRQSYPRIAHPYVPRRILLTVKVEAKDPLITAPGKVEAKDTIITAPVKAEAKATIIMVTAKQVFETLNETNSI